MLQRGEDENDKIHDCCPEARVCISFNYLGSQVSCELGDTLSEAKTHDKLKLRDGIT